MTFRQAIIVESHPQDHSVDLVMLDDGTRHLGVQVATPNGSARSGTVDMPAVPASANKWDITKRNGQDMQALVAFRGRNPVVIGFLYPQVNQMTTKDPKMRYSRHQSDVTTSIDGDGNIQLTHPSGTYIRIGETPDRDAYDGKFADQAATDRNTAKRVNIRIGMAGGSAVLTIAPDGAVSLTTQQGINIEAAEGAVIKAQSITLDTPETRLTGNLTVDGETSLGAVATSGGTDIGINHRHNDSGGSGVGGTPV